MANSERDLQIHQHTIDPLIQKGIALLVEKLDLGPARQKELATGLTRAAEEIGKQYLKELTQ